MEGGKQASTIGTLTYTDLADVNVFADVPAQDAGGTVRAPFSIRLARMSAELAANAYDLNIQPWIDAGYADCTFVIEDRVVALDRDSDSKLAAIESEWKRYRARSLIRGTRPIGDLIRAVRQLYVTDLGKSIVMTRMLPDGRLLLAISFIGTTEKFFDWFSNFKLRDESGMHYGFLELARQFDAQASRVALPTLAAALGKESYTFADALSDAARERERFVFWVSGHSQGGALVQTYTHLLQGRGIDAKQIYAYTFAAPTVGFLHGISEPKRYPIYHIINRDDMVPRVGAQIRLGVDCVYCPDDAFRLKHYRLEDLPFAAYERMRMKANGVQSTKDAICFGMAMMHMVQTGAEDEAMRGFLRAMIPHYAVIQRVGVGMVEIAKYFFVKLEEHYRMLTGEHPDTSCYAHYVDGLRNMLAEFGPEVTADAFRVHLIGPHCMRPDKKDEAFVPPYIAIVRKYGSELTHEIPLEAHDNPDAKRIGIE